MLQPRFGSIRISELWNCHEEARKGTKKTVRDGSESKGKPGFVGPMLATRVRELPVGSKWEYEVKWTGTGLWG
jgi:hypothetical protein